MGIRPVLFWVAVSIAQLAGGPVSDRQRQYLNLTEATLRNPIRHEELREALLSPAGVESIEALFERSIDESLALDRELITPELGGEATLDGGVLTLVPYPDPIHPLLRKMVKLRERPKELLSFLEASPDGRDILENTGGLHALLYAIAREPPTRAQLEVLESVTASAVATRFKTWTADPTIQARAIETAEWKGRYVGFWHIHPPRMQAGSFGVGIEPSLEDMENAIELGQFLTIVFQPDGFDAYDLAGIALGRRADLNRARVVRYRAPDWEAHFEERVRATMGK